MLPESVPSAAVTCRLTADVAVAASNEVAISLSRSSPNLGAPAAASRLDGTAATSGRRTQVPTGRTGVVSGVVTATIPSVLRVSSKLPALATGRGTVAACDAEAAATITGGGPASALLRDSNEEASVPALAVSGGCVAPSDGLAIPSVSAHQARPTSSRLSWDAGRELAVGAGVTSPTLAQAGGMAGGRSPLSGLSGCWEESSDGSAQPPPWLAPGAEAEGAAF